MNRSLLFIIFLFVTVGLNAAVDSVFLMTPEVLEQNNILLSSSNPSKLTFNNFNYYNTAQVQYNSEQGDYHNVNTSPHKDIYSMNALSYLRIGNLFLRGNAGYEFMNRQDVAWSGSVNNNDYLVRVGDSIPGLQRGERYTLGAEVGYKVNKLWSVGLGLDYTAFTNNKQVDPRNGNKGICMRINPGFMYTGECFQVGASLIYHYASEDISYMKHGDKEHDVFSIFPLWFYKSTSLQKGGIKRYNNRDNIGGALLFGSVDTSRVIRYALELEGNKESQFVFHNKVMDERGGEAEGVSFGANAKMQIDGGRLRHYFHFRFNTSHLNGFDNLQQLAVVDGVTKWVQYGRIKKSELNNTNLSFCYSLAKPQSTWLSSYEVGLFGQLSTKDKYYWIYPLQYKQEYSQYQIGSFYKKNKVFDKSVLNLSVSLHAQFGSGNPLQRRILEDQQAPDITIKQDLNNLTREFDYNTATSWNVNLYGRYLYQLNHSVALFGACSSYLKYATTTSFKGARHLVLDVSCGVVF